MSTGKIGRFVYNCLLEPMIDTAYWVKGTYISIGNGAAALRQRVHHVARNVLVTSLGWFSPSAKKTPFMDHVELLKQKSYTLFGSKEKEAFKLCFMISALSAQLLIAEEKKQPTKSGIGAKTCNMLLSSLIWLEGEEPSATMKERLGQITTKIEELWKNKQDAYGDLFQEGIATKTQVPE